MSDKHLLDIDSADTQTLCGLRPVRAAQIAERRDEVTCQCCIDKQHASKRQPPAANRR